MTEHLRPQGTWRGRWTGEYMRLNRIGARSPLPRKLTLSPYRSDQPCRASSRCTPIRRSGLTKGPTLPYSLICSPIRNAHVYVLLIYQVLSVRIELM